MKVTQELECQEVEYDFILNSKDALFLPDLHKRSRSCTSISSRTLLKVLNGRTLILLIDETGDCKKEKSNDYVKRQYIGKVGKKENGIVAVTAYGLGGS